MSLLPVTCWLLAVTLSIALPVDLAPTSSFSTQNYDDVTSVFRGGLVPASAPSWLEKEIEEVRLSQSTSTTTTTTAAPSTTRRATDYNETEVQNEGDFIDDDLEYARLLELLERESRETLLSDPGNFVDPEASLEDILRLIEMSDGSFSTNQPETEHERTGDRRLIEEIERDDCPICLDQMGSSHELELELECGHKFHARCIASWSGRRLTEYIDSRPNDRCPVCRRRLTLFDRAEIIERTTDNH